MQQNRYPGLETLRGIAALMVAVGHSCIAIKYGAQDQLWGTLLANVNGAQAKIAKAVMVAFSGDAAVTIFFVLSGTVLGLSLDRPRGGGVAGYASFMRSRALRIYPAHILVLAVVCLLLYAGATNPGDFAGASQWYNWYYLATPSALLIGENAALIDTSLNNPTWTLQVEVVASALLPLMHAASRLRARRWVVQPAMLALLIVGGWLLGGAMGPHLYKFYLGLLIPLVSAPVIPFLRGHTQAVILVALVALLTENQITQARYLGFGVAQALGAALIVLLTMTATTLPRFMRSEILRRLGERSFSFYLWHFPVLWFTYWAMHSTPALQRHLTEHALLDSALVCAVSVLVAYALAGLSYRYVEAPCVRVGRRAPTWPASTLRPGQVRSQ